MRPLVGVVQGAARELESRIRLLSAMPAIVRLSGTADPRTAEIAAALDAAARRTLDAREHQWVDRIEEVRRSLLRSRETVPVTDYGAVEPEAGLSSELMLQGRSDTRVIGDVCRTASKPFGAALILFHLVRKLRPARCLELGTCLGISTAYQAAALRLNGGGTIVSLEGAPALAALAQGNLAALGLDNASVVTGRFGDTLDGVLRDLAGLDYAFIDGHHDGRATLEYFDRIHPSLTEGAAVVFDDIRWSSGMRSAWRALENDSRVRLAVDLRRMGLCVVGAGSAEAQRRWSIPLA
jgi:predicted O-methyltransferase YrrM